MSELAGWLVDQRRKRDWTQKDVAQRVEVDVRQVSRWETGESTPPSRKLRKIARMYEVDEDGLVSAVKRRSSLPPTGEPQQMQVPFYAQKFVRQCADNAGMTPQEWIGRLIAKIRSSPELVQRFINELVREGYEPDFTSADGSSPKATRPTARGIRREQGSVA